MSEDIKLPDLGESTDSATVVKILVSEGDSVAKEDPIVEIESEKAVTPIPAPKAGKIEKLLVEEGQKLKPGQTIAQLAEADSSPKPESEDESPEDRDRQEEDESAPPAEDEPSESDSDTPKEKEASPAPPAPEGETPFVAPASPSLRQAARAFGIDLSRVAGSGRGGRIETDDVRAYVERLQQQAFSSENRSPEDHDFSKWGPIHSEQLSPLRKAIGRRLAGTWQRMPLVTQLQDVDITEVSSQRQAWKESFAEQDAPLTLTAILVCAIAPVLHEFDLFRSVLHPTGNRRIVKDYVHIGIATETGQGLLVPVLRDADSLSLFEICRKLRRLTNAAREDSLEREEMIGSTFSITNQGGLGGGAFTPIPNEEQSGILGVGRATTEPRYLQDELQPRSILPLALTYDHRLIDGAQAVAFIERIREKLEAFPEAAFEIPENHSSKD